MVKLTIGKDFASTPFANSPPVRCKCDQRGPVAAYTLQKWKNIRDNNKPQKNKDGYGWRRLTRIKNNEIEKFRPIFSNCFTVT